MMQQLLVDWLPTVIVAAVTLALVIVTYRQVTLTRLALDLNVRPFLADPPPLSPDETTTEEILFGAPGRQGFTVRRGAFFFKHLDDLGSLYVSVAFQNIGAGLAAIVGGYVEPGVLADVKVSRRFVGPGEIVRVNIAILGGLDATKRFANPWWAMEGFTVGITYQDALGRQTLTSRAVIKQYATQGPFVEAITVSQKRGLQELEVTGRGQY
jgi:hypothetical protein